MIFIVYALMFYVVCLLIFIFLLFAVRDKVNTLLNAATDRNRELLKSKWGLFHYLAKTMDVNIGIWFCCFLFYVIFMDIHIISQNFPKHYP